MGAKKTANNNYSYDYKDIAKVFSPFKISRNLHAIAKKQRLVNINFPRYDAFLFK